MANGHELATDLGAIVLREAGIPGFFALAFLIIGGVLVVYAPAMSHDYMMPLAGASILVGLVIGGVVAIKSMRRRQEEL